METQTKRNMTQLAAIIATLFLCSASCGGGGGEDAQVDTGGVSDTGADTGGGGETGTADTSGETMSMDTGRMERDAMDTSGDDTDVRTETGYDFRTAGPDQFAQVDRLGMPAVSTALAGEKKNAYNRGTPSDDVDGEFTSVVVDNLTAIHNWFDGDLQSLGLTPCTAEDNNDDGSTNVADCIEQTVGSDGPTVASLVIPDTLTLDTSSAPGFPNGRKLADPVIDVTLAVILLDLSTHAPTAFAEMPLNPAENDVEYESSFPYLAPPHQP